MEKTFTTVLFLSDIPHLAVFVKFYVGMAFHVCQYKNMEMQASE